jgi:hypothetical protein
MAERLNVNEQAGGRQLENTADTGCRMLLSKFSHWPRRSHFGILPPAFRLLNAPEFSIKK